MVVRSRTSTTPGCTLDGLDDAVDEFADDQPASASCYGGIIAASAERLDCVDELTRLLTRRRTQQLAITNPMPGQLELKFAA